MAWSRSSEAGPERPVMVPVELHQASVTRSSLETLGQATLLAQELETSVLAVVLGPETSTVASTVTQQGAQRLLFCPSDSGATVGAGGFAELLAEVAERFRPSGILMAATPWGQERAARLATRLHLGLASSVTAWNLGEDGKLEVSRPVYGGRLVEQVEFDRQEIPFLTLRPGLFPVAEGLGNGRAETVKLDLPPTTARTASLVETILRSENERPLAEASVVVSGGAGMGGPEGFRVLEELAEAVGAAVGASRAAVDSGWTEPERQVGQTGTVVSPDLYIACGISGAVQHRAGIRTSRFIVAINIDPQAPIFRFADVGIVGDLFQVVPALTAELKQRRVHT